jgi:hypothetical protein
VKAHFDLFGGVLILIQDRYTVCVECATGSEIVLGGPKGTPWCHGLSGARFGLFGDSVNVGAR